MLEANLFGAWRLTDARLPLLQRSEHQRVVNVSSDAGSHSILWAVTLPDDGPSGELRRDGQPLPW